MKKQNGLVGDDTKNRLETDHEKNTPVQRYTLNSICDRLRKFISLTLKNSGNRQYRTDIEAPQSPGILNYHDENRITNPLYLL